MCVYVSVYCWVITPSYCHKALCFILAAIGPDWERGTGTAWRQGQGYHGDLQWGSEHILAKTNELTWDLDN